jgi:hypothetical protein
MNKEDLRFTRLAAQASILPNLAALGPRGLTPQALLPKDASDIYGQIARYGYANFRIIPGGAEINSGDGIAVVQLTGSAWSFVHDLSNSAFDVAVEKMAVTIEHFMGRMPRGTRMLGHVIDLQAVWDNVDGGDASQWMERRFLKDQARQVAAMPEGFEFNGAGLRLNLQKDIDIQIPLDVHISGPATPKDSFDLRIEPLFAERTKLYLQVTGMWGIPFEETALVTGRARLVRDMLWTHLAGNILME